MSVLIRELKATDRTAAVVAQPNSNAVLAEVVGAGQLFSGILVKALQANQAALLSCTPFWENLQDLVLQLAEVTIKPASSENSVRQQLLVASLTVGNLLSTLTLTARLGLFS